MALAIVCSKEVALLSLIRFALLLPLFLDFVSVLCVVVQYLVYVQVLHLIVKERELVLYFNCILDVMWLIVFRTSYSRCCRLVCSV